ncbi:MAG: tetratricopeptide repeat protein [Blastocatellia bacterium]|nr:tetratricopeptide repeat protein [Blastocatellia bacterium]
MKNFRESESFLLEAEAKTEHLHLKTDGANLQTADYSFFERIKTYQKAIATFFIVFTTAFGIWYFGFSSANAKPIESLAVMPFINENGNPNVEYLSEGMTDALINNLSQIPKINIKGRSSVFRYKGKDYAVDKIGRELNVQAILSGRIIQYGDELTLYLSLEDVKTGYQIWGEQYNRKLDNVISLRTEVARDVVSKLQVKLSGEDERQLEKKYTANAEADRLYQLGRYHWNKRTAIDMQKALDYFQQAVALDPNYALAYTGIADTYALISNYGDAPPPLVTKPKAKEFALKALSLDEQLAEAHAALGLILTEFDYNFAEAETHYKRAIELNPNYATVRQFYGELLSHLGRFDESVAQFQKALEIDPLSPVINRTYGGTLYQARKYDEAIFQLKKMLDLNPTFGAAYATLSVVYNLKGEYAEGNEAYAKFQELSGLPERAALIRESFARGGRKEVLSELTKEPQLQIMTSYIAAAFLAELGEKERAIVKLNESLAKHEYQIVLLKNDPRLDSLRDDSRFQDIIRRIGFL